MVNQDRSKKLSLKEITNNMEIRLWICVLLITVLMSINQVFCGYNNTITCPKDSNCTCQRSQYDNDMMICPSNGPTSFLLHHLAESTFELNCMANVRGEDYSMIPELIFVNPKHTPNKFIFKNCPLPMSPFSDIITRLGTHELLYLDFSSPPYKIGDGLKKTHFNGLEKITKLILVHAGLTELPSDIFSHMQNLTLLNLRYNRLHLFSEIFQNNMKMQYLDLGHNMLQELPIGIFKPLNKLKTLRLWQNNLSNMTPDTFDGLENLMFLDLNYNKIETFPPNIFHNLPNLSELKLSLNKISSLPMDLFSKNFNLKVVLLQGNMQKLNILPENLLSNLSILSHVRFNKCGIATVHESIFWHSKNIENINLQNNNLKTISKDLFRDQISLKKLSLRENQIMSIPDEAFNSLKQLIFLDLDFNKLEKISENIFSYLRNLEILTVKNNKLLEIDDSAFFNARNIKSIDFSYNYLSFNHESDVKSIIEQKSPFQKIQDLKHLNLSHNAILFFFPDWTIPGLKLDLSYNKIQKILFTDISFMKPGGLIDLRNNNITNVDFSSANSLENYADKNFAVADSVKMFIDDNPFNCDCFLYDFKKYIEGKFNPIVQKLINIDLGYVKCSSPKNLENKLLKDVQSEDLLCLLDSPKLGFPKRCPNNCECHIRIFDFVLILNCSNSKHQEILHLPDVQGVNQTELYYENNTLKNLSLLSTNRKYYNKIKILSVRRNNISTLNEGDIPKEIEILDISYNNLTYIKKSTVEKLKNSTALKEISIFGNPISCNCNNYHFIEFLQENFMKIRDLSQVTCANGQSISKLKRQDLCKTIMSFVIIICSVFVSFLCLILCIITYLYYKHQHDIKVWLYAHSLCLWWITEKNIDKNKIYDAFISFCQKDEDFVEELHKQLEQGPNPFKLCIHLRDWTIGEMITTQIIQSIEDSKRTIIILSPDYLKSVWGIMEFKEAHKKAMLDKLPRVIVILYGDILPEDDIDEELKSYLNTNTYIKWGEPRFWERLRYALPHLKNNPHHTVQKQVTRKKIINENLVLIQPTSPTTSTSENTSSFLTQNFSLDLKLQNKTIPYT